VTVHSATWPTLAKTQTLLWNRHTGFDFDQTKQGSTAHCLHSIRHLQLLVYTSEVEINSPLAAVQGGSYFSAGLSFENQAQDFYLTFGEIYEAISRGIEDFVDCHRSPPFTHI
jgi:hypothetical protein